jgi:hypothetical protein
MRKFNVGKRSFGLIAVFLVLGLAIAACCAMGYSSYAHMTKQKNADKARLAFTALRQTEDGAKAVYLANEITALNPNAKKIAPATWLTIVGVANANELQKFVQEAYWKQGMKDVRELQALKCNPARAIELRSRITLAQEKSGEPIANFGTSMVQINQLVLLNKLRDAARDASGTLTIANLRAAGVLAPEVRPVVAKHAPIKVPIAGKKTATRKIEVAQR